MSPRQRGLACLDAPLLGRVMKKLWSWMHRPCRFLTLSFVISMIRPSPPTLSAIGSVPCRWCRECGAVVPYFVPPRLPFWSHAFGGRRVQLQVHELPPLQIFRLDPNLVQQVQGRVELLLLALFALFALQQILVLMYHGTPAERAEMRRTTLALQEDWPPKDTTPRAAPAPAKGKDRGNVHVHRRGRGRGRGAATLDGDGFRLPPASPARRSARNAVPSAAAPVRDKSRRARRKRKGWHAMRRGRSARGEAEAEEEEEAAASDHDADDADFKTEKPLTKAEPARKALDKKHDDHFAAFYNI
ncbi:hypothetical protein B0H14DRAFT_3522884 [Mycena olivaceomarginata]|nr:hypothetical protein B0H14DRAFT_3522884 [Mycena olivaceomarginata]